MPKFLLVVVAMESDPASGERSPRRFQSGAGNFLSSQTSPSYFVARAGLQQSRQYFLPQGRITNTYNLADNATYIRGRHTFQFGFQTQQVRIASYDSGRHHSHLWSGRRRRPEPASPPGNCRESAPRIWTTRTSCWPPWAGWSTATASISTSPAALPGFVDGAPFLRHYSFDNYAGYISRYLEDFLPLDRDSRAALRVFHRPQRARLARADARRSQAGNLHQHAALRRDAEFRRELGRPAFLQSGQKQLRAQYRPRVGRLRQRARRRCAPDTAFTTSTTKQSPPS